MGCGGVGVEWCRVVPYIILDGVHIIKSHFTLFITLFIFYFIASFLPLFYLIYPSLPFFLPSLNTLFSFSFLFFLFFLLQAHNFDNFDTQSVDSYTFDAPGIEDNDCDVDRFRQRESYEREVGVVWCVVVCYGVMCCVLCCVVFCVVVVWCGGVCYGVLLSVYYVM